MCSLQRNYDVIRNWERFETGPLTVYNVYMSYVPCAQGNRLIEKVLLSTHNMCFVEELKKKKILMLH